MQATALESEHAVALRGETRIVGGHDRSQSVFAMHLTQQVMQRVSGWLIEVTRRFIG